ncbi:hypothetical protein OSTOST_11543, partial [Ostertagia ostertagi]
SSGTSQCNSDEPPCKRRKVDDLSQTTGDDSLAFEDEDAETLSMRLKLIESLQNKIAAVDKEREDGEVTDEEASGTPRPSSQTRKETSSSSRLRKTGHGSDNQERRDRGASSSLRSSSSHRSKRQREETHGKTDTPNTKHKPVDMVESCNPSSIRIQVREGGGRVAQLSTSTKPKDMASCPQKPKPISVQCVQIEPHFSNLSEKTDNYEDVGMDVESSHSSCDSDTGHGDNEGIPSPRHRIISDADEAQLREMLLHQVILNRKRNAESAGQSSSASICDGRAADGPSRANVSECGDEEETADTVDVKNVLIQTSEVNNEIVQEAETSNSAFLAGSSGASRCNSDEPPRKRREGISSHSWVSWTLKYQRECPSSINLCIVGLN